LWTFFCSALPVLPQESRSGAKSLRKKSLTLMQQTDNERKENLPGIAERECPGNKVQLSWQD
ncbi:MAG: hypothetical protein OXC26_08850, partial [Albidovulum sp.]|nr:hypothetical protein [Albidovulum sp.]